MLSAATIAASYPFDDPVAIVYNDEGKLTVWPPLNRACVMSMVKCMMLLLLGIPGCRSGCEDFNQAFVELAQKARRRHQLETF